MIPDEVKEKIFADERMHNVPLYYQGLVVRVVEDALDENNKTRDSQPFDIF